MTIRVSTNQLFDRSIANILSSQERLSEVQQNVATGRAILTPSDDPVGAAQVIRLTEEIDQLRQFQRNNNLFVNALEQEEAVLRNVNDSVNRARQLAIQAGNGILEAQDRTAIGIELENIRDEIFDLANSQNADGEFIFAGSSSQSPAFIFNPSAVGNEFQFQGDDTVNEIQLSDSIRLPSGDSGRDVFENAFARFNTTLDATTAASAGLSVQQQAAYDRFFETNFDAVTPANNDFQATINGAGNQVSIINVGTGVSFGNVDFTSGQPFTFNGIEFNVTGVAGDTVDFSLDPPVKRNLAQTINDFINVLNDPNIGDGAYQEALSDVIVGIDNGREALANATSSIGGRLNVADSILSANLDFEVSTVEARSSIQDVDLAEAISELSQQQNALEASQATFASVTQLSLFDFI
jgi:flagellar hook-associated protein 3 FlgL